MRYPTALLLPFAWLFLGMSAHAGGTAGPPGTSQAETTWMSVQLDGRKIGSLQIERQISDQTVTTTQTLSMTIDRIGKPLHLGSMTRTVEGLDGTALGFASRSSLSSMDSTIEGVRVGTNRFEVTTTIGGEQHRHTLQLPADAMMLNAQRHALKAANAHVGEQYVMQQFDPGNLQVMPVTVTVIGPEAVMLPDGMQTLTHQRQQLLLPNGSQIEDLWVDQDGDVRKGQLELLGLVLKMIACDKACALAPNQGLDMFRAAMVDSPDPIPAILRDTPLTYYVHVAGDSDRSPFIDTDEQHVYPLGGDNWGIDINRAQAGGQAPPTAQDTAPNAWLQSDAPAIRALAAKAVGPAKTNLQKIRRLRLFVSGYITQHGLDVGYASALEVLKNRTGDCTEFAVLLAAMARSENIPARVVTGLVYAGRVGGAHRVFVPHAWVQAWIDGRWQSYDAALHHFDSSHIALTSGNGDPTNFFRSDNLYGRIRIDRVVSNIDAIVSPSMPTSPPPSAHSGEAGSGG